MAAWKWMNYEDLPDAKRAVIIELFLHGNSINHIVFLLHYEARIDAVTEALRREVRFANGK